MKRVNKIRKLEARSTKHEVGSRRTEDERVRECESERVRNGEIVIINNNPYSMMNEEYKIANNESERKIPVKGRLIPEGLHVYRKAVNMVNSTPAGVAQIVVSYRFYKHLMPLASGKPGNKPTWMKLHSALSANRRTEILNGNTPLKFAAKKQKMRLKN
jgi:hypothetical protein